MPWNASCLFDSEVKKETNNMKKSSLAIATLFLFSAGSIFALDPPRFGQNGNQNPNQGQGPGQQRGQRNGKKLGSQDGSGPIHQPGTGGGTGAGQRRGRR